MSDLISRQAAIDAVIKWFGREPSDIGAFENIIEKLPSAQPKVIRCKDCRFLEKDFNNRLHCTLYMDAHSPWAESRYEPEPDDFCSRAERRTDETD